MDFKDTKAHIEGLAKRLKNLRAEQGKFLGAQSIDGQIARAQKEINGSRASLVTEKETLAGLKQKKSDGLKFTIISMQEKLSETLPKGEAGVTIEDSSVSIGWQFIDGFVRYESLSGGEKKIFEQALARTMLDKGGVLVYEAAEVDVGNLTGLMKAISSVPYQVILNHHHRPRAVKGWSFIAR